MPELEQVTPQDTAGYVSMSSARAKRKARMEAEEAEIEALMKGVDANDPEEKEVQPEPEKSQTREDSEESALPENSEERTFKKRYGDLRRHSQAKERELLDRIKELEEGQSSGVNTPPKSKEELEEWMRKYPDVAAIVKSIANQEATKLTSDTAEKLRAIEEREYELKVKQVMNSIKKVHPDLDKIMDYDPFHDWAEAQPKWIQDALYENEPETKALVAVINLYKEETGQKEPVKKKTQREAATFISGKSYSEPVAGEKPTFSESQVYKNSDAWYAKNESAIHEAMREGRFVYDMSGGAR